MSLILNGDGSVGVLSATEMGYLDGVTSAVQAQLNSKPTGGTGAWIAYTPTITGFTIGNGTATGSYIQIGKLLAFKAAFQFGSTSAAAADFCTFSLPVTPTLAFNMPGVFSAGLIDWNPGQYYSATAMALQTNVVRVGISGANGLYTAFSTTSPFTWAVSDVIQIYGTYEAA